MNKVILSFGVIIALFFSSCDKFDLKKGCKEDYLGTKKYVYEPIVYSVDCDCIVSGKVKYLVDGKTSALVDYGSGSCDNWAAKTSCPDGNCKGGTVTNYQFDCATESAEEGDVSEEEKKNLGLN